MILAIQIFQIIFYCIGILFMITLSILSIWSFVIFNKMYKNQRINNFLLDKINQSILNHTYNRCNDSKETLTEDKFNVDEVINESELFNEDKNIISF